MEHRRHEHIEGPQPRRRLRLWRVAIAVLALWGAVTALVWAIGVVQRVSAVVVVAVILFTVVAATRRS